MKFADTAASVAVSLAEIEAKHPELHALLSRLADELEASEIDPDSTLAGPAEELVNAFHAFQS